MEIIDQQSEPGLIRLGDLKDVQPYTSVFRYDGHLYSRISKLDSMHTDAVLIDPHGGEYQFVLRKTHGHVAAINLRSMTIRGIPADELVRPVRAEVHTFPMRPFKR